MFVLTSQKVEKMFVEQTRASTIPYNAFIHLIKVRNDSKK